MTTIEERLTRLEAQVAELINPTPKRCVMCPCCGFLHDSTRMGAQDLPIRSGLFVPVLNQLPLYLCPTCIKKDNKCRYCRIKSDK
jgi:hypothetical protein